MGCICREGGRIVRHVRQLLFQWPYPVKIRLVLLGATGSRAAGSDSRLGRRRYEGRRQTQHVGKWRTQHVERFERARDGLRLSLNLAWVDLIDPCFRQLCALAFRDIACRLFAGFPR